MRGQVGEAVTVVLVLAAVLACVAQHLNEYFPGVKDGEASQNVQKR